jgi:hypothetical protein
MRDSSILESLTEKQWDRIFYSCPGAWAGNKPQPNQTGSVVIDGKNILAAEIWCSDGGIILVIGLRY